MRKIAVINANVYTVDKATPCCEAFLIEGDRIKAVGSSDAIIAAAGEDALTIDAEGRLILPGFIDAHCHPAMLAYSYNALDVSACVTKDEYRETIRKYADEHPGQDTLKGSGWFYADFGAEPPTRELIDAAVTDRPVILYSGDFHAILVNSKTLEACGLSDDTASPEGGIVGKDADGHLTGYFHDKGVALVEERISIFTAGDFKAGILHFFEDASRVGITAVSDAGLLDAKGWGGYAALSDEEYPLKVFVCEIFKPDEDLSPEAIDARMKERKLAYDGEHLDVNTVKLFLDGNPESNTALMEEPYLNDAGNRGVPLWPKDLFRGTVAAADKLGYRVQVHCLGDRSARYTVEAFEHAAQVNGRRDSRHIAAHLQFMSDVAKDKMAEYGVVAIPTAFWFEKSDMYYKVELINIGKERADGEYPMRSLIDRGVVVACGSDAPAGVGAPILDVAYAPLQAIQQGVTRCSPLQDCTDPANISNPPEAATLEQMIETYTINGAVANFAEAEMGSITPGKLANFIILDTDIFAVPPDRIYETKVDETWYRGRCVFAGD
jgi:predicted amidohydrolase YtcJ